MLKNSTFVRHILFLGGDNTCFNIVVSLFVILTLRILNALVLRALVLDLGLEVLVLRVLVLLALVLRVPSGLQADTSGVSGP